MRRWAWVNVEWLLRLAAQMEADNVNELAVVGNLNGAIGRLEKLLAIVIKSRDFWRRSYKEAIAQMKSPMTEGKFLTNKEMDDTAGVIAGISRRVMQAEAERDTFAAKVAEYEAKLAGCVVVKPGIFHTNTGGYKAEVKLVACGGRTPEQAIANLQAAIDKGDADG